MRTKRSRLNGDRKRRGSRGGGRLYKRGLGGKEYPADSPIGAPYWIAYTIPNPKGGRGQVVRQALKDECGEPITDRTRAEAERRRIIAPFQARDAAEAQRQILARLQAAETAVAEADEAAELPLKIAVADEAYQASERRPDSGPVTLEGYLSQWGRFADWASKRGLVFLRDVTRDHVKAYVGDMNSALFSPSTFNQHLKTLVRFWTVLADEARVRVNPWMDVRLKTLDRIERRKRALTLAEASAVIDAADPGDMRDLLTLVACTGQRLGDVCLMRWSSVDLAAGVIELVRAKTRRRKGESVFIPILPQARAVLEGRQGSGEFVLPVLAEQYQRDGASISKRIQATFAWAGIQTKRQNGKGRAICEAGGHSLRHTFNTVARWAGLPDALIQKVTGHSSARMTDPYSQFDRALVSTLARTFEALPAGSGGPLALPAFAGTTPAARAELPAWAREVVQHSTPETWGSVKAELLNGGRP